MQDATRRGVVWPLLLVVAVTALTSIIVVVASTASAGLDGGGGDSGPEHLRFGTSGRAMVAVPAMIPGRAIEHCITVESEVARAERSELRVYGWPSGDLVDHLELTVRSGSIGSTCDVPGQVAIVFSGRLADFGRDYATASRVEAWPTGEGAVPFLVAVTLGEHTPDSAQGMGADLELIWEVRGAAAQD